MFKKSAFTYNFLRIFEDSNLNYNLDLNTKFNHVHPLILKNCVKISLNFGFKEIKFEKKQMVIYFFLLELLSNQKCILTTSRKNVILLKIKKGSVTGCKVTLRKENLASFIDTLILGLPRSEIFKGFSFKKSTEKHLSFSTKIKNLFIFYTLESEIISSIKTLDITFNFNTINDFEKCFFFTYNKIPLKYF